MDRALPVAVSISINTPFNVTRSVATPNRCGRYVMKRRRIGSISRPRMLSCGPVKPASHRKAVPPGKICSSAVCTCVWVPTTALTRPSRKRPIAIFSDVVSAWMSTKMMEVSFPNFFTASLAAKKGFSIGFMNVCPCKFRTPTGGRLSFCLTTNPCPGVPSG